ncbi:MAG: SDR family oxidoreductase [Pseudomonadota bacterium]
MLSELKKRYALITGGSSGIGLALSQLFAKSGYSLIIVSNSAEELEHCVGLFASHFPETEVTTICIDLAKQGSPEAVYQRVKRDFSCISILVNSAGFATYGPVIENAVQRETDMINLNVTAVYQLTRLFLADMDRQGEGYILNVASSAGVVPVPNICTYAATKAFVLHFSDALNFELKHLGSNVSVTALCPPPVPTNFQTAAGMDESKIFKSSLAMEVNAVAKAGYKALFSKKSMLIPGVSMKVLLWLCERMPRVVRMRLLKASF